MSSSSDLETKSTMEYDPSKDEKNVDVLANDEAGSLDDDDNNGTITLVSSDEKKFTLEKKSAFVSKLVSQALENDATATEIPMPGAKGAILELVVQYMTHHAGTEPPIIEKPLRSKLMKDVCKDKWDAEFIDAIGPNRQQLYDLILAANYMDVKSLLHLGCAKVASLIKGQPLEKIKDILAVDQSANKAASGESKTDAPPAPAAPASAPGSASSSSTESKTQNDSSDETEQAGDVTMHTSG